VDRCRRRPPVPPRYLDSSPLRKASDGHTDDRALWRDVGAHCPGPRNERPADVKNLRSFVIDIKVPPAALGSTSVLHGDGDNVPGITRLADELATRTHRSWRQASVECGGLLRPEHPGAKRKQQPLRVSIAPIRGTVAAGSGERLFAAQSCANPSHAAASSRSRRTPIPRPFV
jgi:hypothetical protein